MESSSSGFEVGALLFGDDTDFLVDGLTKSRRLSKKWDGEDAVDRPRFIEPLLPDAISTSFLGDHCFESYGDDHSPSPATIVNDDKCGAVNLLSADNSALSTSMSSKRAKIGDSQSPIPTCQVHGCNKDLSSSKDYHKRHKVCDVHSKTAVVIVNGIRQRFCQQCSRFHILAEFDEGKRSCRKRLAGHNERRRKPQFNSCIGSTYFTTDASNSLLVSGVLPGSFLGLQPTDRSRHLMLEEDPLAVHVKSSQLLPISLLRFHGHGLGKQYHCLKAPSDSTLALSLLSAQKQNSLSNSAAGMSMAQDSGTTLGDCSSRNSGVHARAAAGLGIPQTALPQGTNTVDLLELSLHLHRVEHQKYYGQIKMETDNFCDSTTV